MIDITNVDLRRFVKEVYNLSAPQGLGFLHFTTEPLSDEDVDKLLSRPRDRVRLSMDYVHGRACKMTVFVEKDKLVISDDWYDHTGEQFKKLLSLCGIKYEIKETGHGMACNCSDCQVNRELR